MTLRAFGIAIIAIIVIIVIVVIVVVIVNVIKNVKSLKSKIKKNVERDELRVKRGQHNHEGNIVMVIAWTHDISNKDTIYKNQTRLFWIRE